MLFFNLDLGDVRVITRYVGSGIRRMGCEIAALGSGITDHGIGISSFFRDQGSGCTIFVGSGTKTVTVLESRIRNLCTKMGSVMKKHTSLPP